MGSRADSLHGTILCRLCPESGHLSAWAAARIYEYTPLARSVPRAHGAYPDTLGKFAVLSRKFPVLLRREFRRNHLIYRAEKRSRIPFLRLNQRNFPVLSRLTGKIPAETGSLVTASTCRQAGEPEDLNVPTLIHPWREPALAIPTWVGNRTHSKRLAFAFLSA